VLRCPSLHVLATRWRNSLKGNERRLLGEKETHQVLLQPKGNTNPREQFHVPSGIGKALILTGVVEEGSGGLILGLLYLGCRKNLAVPIVARGVCDTIDIVLLFFGKYPG
jgi:hypothetical protein